MNNLKTLLLLILIISSCAKVPISGRKQLHLVNEQNLIEMSKAQYSEFLSQANVLPETDSRAQRVVRVGNKIKTAVETFMKNKGLENRIKGFSWEFKTVEEETINAWCMPGGKVCVYTGILGLTSTDDELAVVMGHEIAHAIARHGNERMSEQLAVSGIGSLTGLTPQDSTESVNIYQRVYMGSATLGMLKFSRTHESEADKLGLVFMKIAGYDPEQAITFWKKMAASGGANIPEILSTHPSDETRIHDLEEFLTVIDQYID